MFNRDNYSTGFSSSLGGGNFNISLSINEILSVLKDIQTKLAKQIQNGDDSG